MLFCYSFPFALCACLCCHLLPWATHERLWLHLPLRCWGFSSYSPGPGQNLVLLVCPLLALLPVFPILVMRPHSTPWPSRILDITLGASPVLPIPVTSFLNLDHVLPFLFLPFLLWFLLYQLSPWPLLSPYCCSVTVVSDSLQPHGLQHARLPRPSPSPGVCSNSCPFCVFWSCQLSHLLLSSVAFYRLLPDVNLKISWFESPMWRETRQGNVFKKKNYCWIIVTMNETLTYKSLWSKYR